MILALSHKEAKGCNFSYAQLHVALLRVEYSKHMRLLLTGNSEWRKWMSIQYIDSLEPDPLVPFYFGGFREVNGDADPNAGWLDNEWSADRANESFKRRYRIATD